MLSKIFLETPFFDTFTQFHQFDEDDHGYDDFVDCGVDDNDDNDDDDDNVDGVFDECENEFSLVLDHLRPVLHGSSHHCTNFVL